MMIAASGRGDDEECVAVGIVQPKPRWDTGERRATPPDHFTLGEWSLIHVDLFGSECGVVGEHVSAEEHDPRLDPCWPLRATED
jgi:hypothetical protein